MADDDWDGAEVDPTSASDLPPHSIATAPRAIPSGIAAYLELLHVGAYM